MVATAELEAQSTHPVDIAGHRFSLVRKGYDPDEVDRYLRHLSEVVARLQGEVEWQRARGEHLERRTAAAQEAAYARLSRDFMEVVRRADEAAGRVRAEAEAEARAETGAAHREAARLLAAAAEQAEAILTQARAEAERIRPTTSAAPASRDQEGPRSDPSNTWTLAGLWQQAEAAADPTPGSDGTGNVAERPSDPDQDEALHIDLDASLFDLFEDFG